MKDFISKLEINKDRSLSRKVSVGALWVTTAIVSMRFSNVVILIILARLLDPEDFGLIALATTIMTFSENVSQTGFESAIIQRQDRSEDFLNTAWTFEIIRYLFLFVIIFFLAPLLAIFFQEPRVTLILRVISFSLLFYGFRNIAVVFFRKNLDFKKQFIFEIIPTIIYACTVIPLALYLKSVWALVWGNFTRSMAVCFVSYVMHSYRPQFDFNFKRAAQLFHFGKWILSFSVLTMIRENGSMMFIAKFLGTTLLGFYKQGVNFSLILFQHLSQVAWRVVYPAYSQLLADPSRLKQAYCKTAQLLTFIGIPMAGGLFVLSRDFIHLFLTDKWLPSLFIIRVFCLQAILIFINTPASIFFRALGRPSIETKITALGILVTAVAIYPLSLRWGILGVAISLLLGRLISIPFTFYKLITLTGYSLSKIFKPIFIALFNTVIMCGVITYIKINFLYQASLLNFFVLIFLGVFTYLMMAFCFDRWLKYGSYDLIKHRFAVLWQVQ